MEPDDHIVSIGPITLRLTQEAVKMVTDEWSRRAPDFTEQTGKIMSIEDVVSAMLNEVASDDEEEESEDERMVRLTALLHDDEEEEG